MTGTGVAVIPTFADDAAPRVVALCWRLERLVPLTVVVANGAEVARALDAADLPANVRVIDPRRNLGFGGGVNTGLERAGDFDWALIVNDDVTLGPAFDWQLEEHTRQLTTDRVAALSLFRGALDRVRPCPSGAGALLRIAGLWPIARRLNALARRPHQFEFFLVLVSGVAWSEVSGFDAEYFPLYFEDADLVVRWQRAGWRVAASPSDVSHEGSRTSRKHVETVSLVSLGAYNYLTRDLAWPRAAASAAVRLANGLGAAVAGIRGRRREVIPRLAIVRRPVWALQVELPPYERDPSVQAPYAEPT